MNEQDKKIAKIKNNCRIGKVIATIMCIICICGCVLSAVAGIAMLVKADEWEPKISQAVEEGKIDTNKISIGTAKMFHIEGIDPDDWESDVPAIQDALTNRPYTTIYGGYCLGIAACIAVCAVLMKLISGTFAIIEKEDNPFTDKVIKRVTVVMIVVSAFLFFTAGAAFGILGGLVTLVVYSIFDYAKTLQIQSDETL